MAAERTWQTDAGTPRFGAWCAPHALPHAFLVDALYLDETGVRTLGTYVGCDLDDDQVDDEAHDHADVHPTDEQETGHA